MTQPVIELDGRPYYCVGSTLYSEEQYIALRKYQKMKFDSGTSAIEPEIDNPITASKILAQNEEANRENSERMNQALRELGRAYFDAMGINRLICWMVKKANKRGKE